MKAGKCLSQNINFTRIYGGMAGGGEGAVPIIIEITNNLGSQAAFKH